MNKSFIPIVLFTHPSFMQSQSMPRYAKMLLDYFKSKGYKIDAWSPKPFFYKFGFSSLTRKWLGYIDQYLVFPIAVWFRLIQCDAATLFVFTDQALGPWVPLVANRKHVIHCHDFLALRSSLGELPENYTCLTGRWYQSFIRKGFSKGKNFISVSKQTQIELHQYYKGRGIIKSEVIYNGLNQKFELLNQSFAQTQFEAFTKKKFSNGYIIHVGGNQWYKNRKVVVELYSAWRVKYGKNIDLVLLGQEPDEELVEVIANSSFNESIHIALDIPNDYVNVAYSGAKLLLFPSLAEGFGWPIAEAMASGVPTLTTNEAPMTEVGGDIAYYIKRMPYEIGEKQKWIEESIVQLEYILTMPEEVRVQRIVDGLLFVEKFSAQQSLESIEFFYNKIE